jgi:hypothetical protein
MRVIVAGRPDPPIPRRSARLAGNVVRLAGSNSNVCYVAPVRQDLLGPLVIHIGAI